MTWLYVVKNSEGIEYIAHGYDEADELCDELNDCLMEDSPFYVELKKID